jgi:hypothetical protein
MLVLIMLEIKSFPNFSKLWTVRHSVLYMVHVISNTEYLKESRLLVLPKTSCAPSRSFTSHSSAWYFAPWLGLTAALFPIDPDRERKSVCTRARASLFPLVWTAVWRGVNVSIVFSVHCHHIDQRLKTSFLNSRNHHLCCLKNGKACVGSNWRGWSAFGLGTFFCR